MQSRYLAVQIAVSLISLKERRPAIVSVREMSMKGFIVDSVTSRGLILFPLTSIVSLVLSPLQ